MVGRPAINCIIYYINAVKHILLYIVVFKHTQINIKFKAKSD